MKKAVMLAAPMLLAMFGIIAELGKISCSAFLLEQPVCPEELLK